MRLNCPIGSDIVQGGERVWYSRECTVPDDEHYAKRLLAALRSDHRVVARRETAYVARCPSLSRSRRRRHATGRKALYQCCQVCLSDKQSALLWLQEECQLDGVVQHRRRAAQEGADRDEAQGSDRGPAPLPSVLLPAPRGLLLLDLQVREGCVASHCPVSPLPQDMERWFFALLACGCAQHPTGAVAQVPEAAATVNDDEGSESSIGSARSNSGSELHSTAVAGTGLKSLRTEVHRKGWLGVNHHAPSHTHTYTHTAQHRHFQMWLTCRCYSGAEGGQ